MSKSVTRIAAVATTASAVALGVSALAGAPAQATSSAASAVAATRSSTDKAGWVAVERAEGRSSTAVIQLMSPTGTVGATLRVPRSELLAQVSHDGRRVLTQQSNRSNTTYRVHDLSTNRVTAFTGSYAMVEFTAPSGAGLLAQPFTASGVGTAAVQRLDLAGHRQVTFPGTIGNDFMPSLDGKYLVATTADSRLTVSSNSSGHLLRVLPKPKGYDFCTPLRNASASAVYAVCGRSSDAQVYRYNLAGGAAVSMTGSLTARPFGYVDYWTQPSGTWVHEGAGCGSGPLLKVAGRSTHEPSTHVAGSLAGVAGNTAFYEDGECDASDTVSALNLSTGHVTRLVTGSAARPMMTWVLVDPTR